jgi:hypothetical protein
MRRQSIVTAAALCLIGQHVLANEYVYQDDDLLCGPGFTPESYYQKIQQHAYQQMATIAQSQNALAYELAYEQKVREKRKVAHQQAIEKERRRKEEIIAKRQAANISKVAANSKVAAISKPASK